jgi:hypothetical protein
MHVPALLCPLSISIQAMKAAKTTMPTMLAPPVMLSRRFQILQKSTASVAWRLVAIDADSLNSTGNCAHTIHHFCSRDQLAEMMTKIDNDKMRAGQ